MPIYEYACQHKRCKYTKDVLHTVAELKEPSEETLKEITCPKHGVMQRQMSVPHLANMKGGVSVSEKELLADKQARLKKRSRMHFKNDVLPDLPDRQVKKHFEKKYKGLKGDHEKIK